MKIYKSLCFLFGAIALLCCISIFFPKDGIKIGFVELHFPSIEEVLLRDHVPASVDTLANVIPVEEMIKDTILQDDQDTLNFYKNLINNQLSRIDLPNDNYDFFNSFFEKAVQAKSRGEVIRVIHYGDSQIELDRISKNLRTFFQSKFGGGGPGLLPIVQTVPTATVRQWASESFTPYSIFGNGARDAENRYGIMAKYYRLHGNGTCRISHTHTNHIRLLLTDHDGAFTATLTDQMGEYEETKVTDSMEGFKILEWWLPRAMNDFSLNLQGNADLYGMMVDYGSGVTVDNIPMRGCAGTIFNRMNSQLLRQSFTQTNVGMIILQYGGNAMPGMTSRTSVDAYAQNIGKQIQFFQKIYPNTPILFIGPSDMATKVQGTLCSYPLLKYMVEKLRETALTNGAAFWNIYEVMGGENSILTWVKYGLAGSDYIHFSQQGANKIGEYLVNAFSTIYDYFNVNKKIEEKHSMEQYSQIEEN